MANTIWDIMGFQPLSLAPKAASQDFTSGLSQPISNTDSPTLPNPPPFNYATGQAPSVGYAIGSQTPNLATPVPDPRSADPATAYQNQLMAQDQTLANGVQQPNPSTDPQAFTGQSGFATDQSSGLTHPFDPNLGK